VTVERVAAALGALAQRDAPLGARTTYRVGGTAAVLVEATTPAELDALAKALMGEPVDVLVVGRGSNLLVSDAGFDGVAVALTGDFEAIGEPIEATNGTVQVRAGGAVPLPVLARRLAELGLRGLEWAVGVPGSVGGAVRMNAGGHGDETAASLVSAEVVDLATGSATVRAADALDLSYRHSSLRPCEVVTFATFALTRGDAAESKRVIADVVRWRREHQPGGANAGSIFQNPPGDHAGRLVEAVGDKGRRHGTAVVSDKHANFIQADAGGSADDVAALIDLVAEHVRSATGVALATEVVRVGFRGER
jgi:UDP-N-acetylmuramate dehydrogenase